MDAVFVPTSLVILIALFSSLWLVPPKLRKVSAFPLALLFEVALLLFVPLVVVVSHPGVVPLVVVVALLVVPLFVMSLLVVSL